MKNKMPLLSIVMPVYNADKYVEAAIKSVINQTFKDWELIIVNDGSTDNSLSLCEDFVKKDNRIACYSKPNGGQASARNVALDKSRGEFITFIDADDEILDNTTYETAINALQNDANISLVQFRSYRVYENGKIIPDFYLENRQLVLTDKKSFFERVETISDYLKKTRSLSSGQWDKVFRREVFDNLRYKEGVIFEDTLLSYYIFNKATKILLLPMGGYGYYMRTGSTTTKERTLHGYRNQIDSQLAMLQGLVENGGERNKVLTVSGALRRFIIGVYTTHGLNSDLYAQIKRLNQLCTLAAISEYSYLSIKLSALFHITARLFKKCQLRR